MTLQQDQQQVEAIVRNRSSWTIQQQTHRIANSLSAPVETRSLPADRASLLDADPMRGGVVIERSSCDFDRPCLKSVIVQRRLQRNQGITEESSSIPIPEPFPGLQASEVREPREVIQVSDDEMLTDILMGDEFFCQ